MSESSQKNVFGEPLEPCSNEPLTGWLRDGCCNTDKNDRGVHTVCAKVTNEFLIWSKKVGNDLITPRPEFGFPGLNNLSFENNIFQKQLTLVYFDILSEG